MIHILVDRMPHEPLECPFSIPCGIPRCLLKEDHCDCSIMFGGNCEFLATPQKGDSDDGHLED